MECQFLKFHCVFLFVCSCLYFFDVIFTTHEKEAALTGTAEQLHGGVFSYKVILRNRVFLWKVFLGIVPTTLKKETMVLSGV